MSADAPVQFAERRVDVDGLELRYIEAGEGESLVWLHGGGGLHPNAGTDLLTHSFRVIGLELPGFGSSWRNAGAQSHDELAETAAAAIEALGLSEYVLHGTSFGGAVALHVALAHPERVSRLILESPAAFRPPGWRPPDAETVRRGLFRHRERARGVLIDPEVAGAQAALVARLSLALDPEALSLRLRDLQVPMLVIFGEEDPLTPPALASRYSDNAPDCSVVLIPDAAHVVSSDQPEAYASAVREFAARARS